MPKFVLKKRVLIALGSAVVLIAAGAAVAYFTSSGSGTGNVSGGNSAPVTLHGTVASTLYPGTSSSVSFTVDNPSPGTQRVGTIHLASVATDAAHSACVVSDFSMPDVAANQSFANGNTQAVSATGLLAMANTGVSQDACQGAPLTLNLTSN